MAEALIFTAPIVVGSGPGAWHMVSLPEDLSDEIDARYAGPKRGFGAVRVHARIGRTRWDTSAFPTRSTGVYVMGINRGVRDAEGVGAGDIVEVSIEVPDLR